MVVQEYGNRIGAKIQVHHLVAERKRRKRCPDSKKCMLTVVGSFVRGFLPGFLEPFSPSPNSCLFASPSSGEPSSSDCLRLSCCSGFPSAPAPAPPRLRHTNSQWPVSRSNLANNSTRTSRPTSKISFSLLSTRKQPRKPAQKLRSAIPDYQSLPPNFRKHPPPPQP